MLENDNIFEGETTKSVESTKAADTNDLLSDIFGEDGENQTEDNKSESDHKKAKESKPSQEKKEAEKPKVEPKAPYASKKPAESKAEADSDDSDDDASSKQSEVEKLKKNLSDSQKWGHTNNRRLKKVSKLVESLKESGVLSENEFNDLHEQLNSDPEEEERIENITRSPIDNLIRLAGDRIDDLREIYEDDELFDKKADSFTSYYNNLSKDDKEDLIEEFDKIRDNKLRLAKRMYQLGTKYYEEELKEVEEAGGFKQLLGKKNSQLENLQKKLDKLTKKLLQYEDNGNPTYNIEESGDTSNLVKSKSYDTVVEEIFGERDRNIGR